VSNELAEYGLDPEQLDIGQLKNLVERLTRMGDTKRLKEVLSLTKSAVDKKQALGRQERWAASPAVWAQERLGLTPWSKQREIMESVRDRRKTAVRSCHSIGKSFVAAMIVCWWLDSSLPGDAFVVTTAPTAAQVRAILWRYIRRMHKDAGLPGRTNQTEWFIDDELVAFGRKPADDSESSFVGIHAPRVLCLIDEACGVADNLWIAAEAITTGPECRILAIGNPDNSASHFFTVSQPGSGWSTLKVSAYDSPNFTGEKVSERAALSLISPEWVEDKKLEWGEDNPLYRSKVLGEFSEDAVDTVVRASDVAACRLDSEILYSPADLSPVELGVDVGGGQDETVIRERRGMLVGREWKLRSDRPEKIAPLILRAIRETGATAVKIDSIGVGFGVIGELRNAASRREHNAQIIGINVSNTPLDKKKFVNLRAELWWNIGREMSSSGAWDLSKMESADDTCAQLLMPRWDLDSKGRIRVELKDDIRKRLSGKSPDSADALLLAYASGLRPRIRILR
jgi:hypothetical protein